MSDERPRVVWQKDVWTGSSWAYGRVVYVPRTPVGDGRRTRDGVKFEIADSRDAMDDPIWRPSEPFEEFYLQYARDKKADIEESKSVPPKLRG